MPNESSHEPAGVTLPNPICHIHSKYLGEKAFPKDISEFEIREFFNL
jgi:hypothetical protein